MIINASSLGIKKSDKIDINYEKIGTNKFYYDVIYNPRNKFLTEAKKLGNKIENGKNVYLSSTSVVSYGIMCYRK